MTETLSQKRRRASLSRKRFGGGGVRVGAGRKPSGERCQCGKNTAKRAKARAFDCCKAAGVIPKTATAGVIK